MVRAGVAGVDGEGRGVAAVAGGGRRGWCGWAAGLAGVFCENLW